MTNSGVTAILGFVFWILAARLYSAEDVGLGSALISAAMLLSFIGTLGLGFGIIRFLPNSNDKARLLNSSFTISFLASIVVTFIFLAGLPLWFPKLMFIRENFVFLTTFIVFVAAATLGDIVARTFIGFRRAGFTLAQGIIVNIIKLILIVAFAAIFKVFGIFASWGLAMGIALAVSLLFFLPQILHRYRLSPSFQRQVMNEIFHFSFANYIGSALWQLPAWILPLMVLNILGSQANAHFYIAWIMANLPIAISAQTSISFFAEGSHARRSLDSNLRRSLKLIALLVIPATIILLLLGDKLLLLFGNEYLAEAAQLLQLLAIAALPASINLLYLGVARVEKKLKHIIITMSAIAFGTLLLSHFLLPFLGILGAGVGWLAMQIIVALVITPKLMKKLT